MINMMHRGSTHHHGILTGYLLAVAIIALAFLLHSDLVQMVQGKGQGLVAGGLVLALLLVLTLRGRAK